MAQAGSAEPSSAGGFSVKTAIAELKKVDQGLATEFAYLELKGDEASKAADISGAKEVAKWADQ